MNNLNSILVEGNLVRDPELHLTPKGVPVCTFSIGSNRFYKQDGQTNQEVSFFDVEVWSKVAENCAEYLTKGRGVRVIGRIKQDRWQDSEGNVKSRIKIVGEHVEFRPNFSRKKDIAEETEDEEESNPNLRSMDTIEEVAEKEEAEVS